MNVQLSNAELRDILDALETRRRELLEELVHTDDRAFQAALRSHLERLEALTQRFDGVIDMEERPTVS